jgi:predicted GH43/DUF377 family glycosyl hydrolase
MKNTGLEMKKILAWMLILILFAGCSERRVLDADPEGPLPDSTDMVKLYEEIKTPFKYGVVLEEEGKKVDCPGIFRHNNRWYMTYIIFDGTGYESALAVSDDLLRWEKLGRTLSFSEGRWDDLQKAGFIALQDPQWGGSYNIENFKGKYWMSYVGGELSGYETDPLSIGIAWTEDPSHPVEWHKLEAPVLTGSQSDARDFEKLTLYKSNILRDPEKRTGYPFIMYYNAKTEHGYERITMAVSRNMVDWIRYGQEPLIDNGSGISGDPQIAKIGELWVMFYFGAFFKPGAFDTFAASYDLINWTKWEGADLIAPSEPYDSTYAHKPWVIKHEDIVYHYYCAVGDRGRVIALATSKPIKY